MQSSIRDIAKATNLSMTTVSWVLSGKGKEHAISDATCKRVEQCAKEMNYQPNLLARSLHVGVTNTLGLIVPSIGDQFYSSIVKFMELEAEKRGYALMVSSSENDLERESKMIDVLRAKQVDGILLAPTKFSQVKIEQMLEDKYPFVLFDRYFPELNTNYVIIDNEDSAFRLVSNLISKGYKKTAILTTNTHLYTMKQRYNGYLNAYANHAAVADNALYGKIDSNNYETSSEEVLDRIFSEVPDVDSFFFSTHVLVGYFFRYCAKRGIKRDFGYASIHTEKIFEVLAPNMDVAMFPISTIGRESVRILLHEIKKRNKKDKPEEKEQMKKGIILSCDFFFK